MASTAGSTPAPLQRPGLSGSAQSRVGSSSSTSTPTTAPTATTTTRNPLQAKVTRLLSANLEDGATRAALDTLGQVELAASRNSTTGSTTTTTNGALSQQQTHGGMNTTTLRKGGLRKEVDTQMAESSRHFLRAFSDVNDVREEWLSSVWVVPALPLRD